MKCALSAGVFVACLVFPSGAQAAVFGTDVPGDGTLTCFPTTNSFGLPLCFTGVGTVSSAALTSGSLTPNASTLGVQISTSPVTLTFSGGGDPIHSVGPLGLNPMFHPASSGVTNMAVTGQQITINLKNTGAGNLTEIDFYLQSKAAVLPNGEADGLTFGAYCPVLDCRAVASDFVLLVTPTGPGTLNPQDTSAVLLSDSTQTNPTFGDLLRFGGVNLAPQATATFTFFITDYAGTVQGFGGGANATFTLQIVPVIGLNVTKTHNGSFKQGQQGATYTLTVSNPTGAQPTSGTVTLAEAPPSGLTVTSLVGTGWTCTTANCTRSDSLAAGSSYPPVTATVNVGATATSPQINQATVSGGGSPSASATDSTMIVAPVSVVSVTPNVGSGTSQTFQFQVSDTLGAGNLVAVEGWFTASPFVAANSCLIYYSVGQHRIYLAADDVSTWSSQNIGTPGTLQNTQCILNAGGTTVTPNGNNLTVSVPITFKIPFAGTKQIFMYGVDTTGNSGWQFAGTWTPSNATVTAVSVTPNAGSGSSQTFQFVASDSGGAADVVAVEGWFTPNISTPANSCLIYYATATQRLYLATDDASTWNWLVIGTASTLQNNQCIVNVGGATVLSNGNNLTLSVPFTFKPGFAGAKQTLMYATGTTSNSGWQLMGNWTTAIATVTAASVTPNSGSGFSQTFQFKATDTGGFGDLQALEGWFTPSPATAANTCLIYYSTASQLMYLFKDDASGWISQKIGTVGTLQNSQCTLDAGGTTVLGAGNNLTLSVPITFKVAFAGTKQVFMYAIGTTGNSGWQVLGSWTPTSSTVSLVSVTPNAGSGSTQTFQFKASDTGGAADILAIQGWFTANTSTPANSCLIYFATATQLLFLLKDDASGWTSQQIGTAGTLQNTQCSLNVGGTTAVGAGTMLTLSIPVTFKSPAFSGAKQTLMYAQGTNNNTGFQVIGGWTAP